MGCVNMFVLAPIPLVAIPPYPFHNCVSFSICLYTSATPLWWQKSELKIVRRRNETYIQLPEGLVPSKWVVWVVLSIMYIINYPFLLIHGHLLLISYGIRDAVINIILGSCQKRVFGKV